MNAATVGQALSALFATQMASQLSTVTIAYLNGQPMASLPNSKTGEWVEYAWRPATDEASALGQTMYRGVGVVAIRIAIGIGLGAGRMQTLIDTIKSIFRDNAIGTNIRFKRASFAIQGEEDGWFKATVTVVIEADEMV